MFGLKQISIDLLAGSQPVTWIALFVLLGLSVYLYVRTNPPLPKYLRVILGALRIIAVAALITMLLEPVVSYTRQFQRPERVALILDRSASMDKVEREKSRSARRDSLLSSDTFGQLKSQVDLSTYYFGGNLTTEADKVDREKTSLGDAIYDLEKQELAAPSDYWLLISDGKSNSGRDPLKATQAGAAPTVAVDISSDVGNFDIGIGDIEFNPVMFVGQPSEVRLKLSWHHAGGKTATIELVDSNRVVTQTTFPIDQDEGMGDVTLKYLPTSPGQKILRINIPPLDQEENTGNNHRTFSVKVLKSRLLTLLVADHPDYEVGFLKRFLDRTDKYDVKLIVTGANAGNLAGRFPTQQTELNRYDLVILYDPDPAELQPQQEVIRSYLSDKGGAIWVFLGEQFSQRGPTPWFDRLLPFSQTVKRPLVHQNFRGEPSEGNLFHPSVRLADNQTSIRQVWSQLPPFQTLVLCDTIDPAATLLAYASLPSRDDAKIPLLGYRRFGAGKLFASTGLPFWPWGFVNMGFGEDASNYGKFIEGTASWLTVSDDMDPMRIVPERDVYHRGEVVRFDGYAFDLGFRPIPDVSGTVKLQSTTGPDRYEADLVAQGEGEYRAYFSNVVPGDYTYSGELVKDGQSLKKSSGKLAVEVFSLEEFDQSGDPAGLQALARLSGGSYYTYQDFDKALSTIKTEPVAVDETNEIVVWNKPWLLLVFLVALSGEWLVRKVNQLL